MHRCSLDLPSFSVLAVIWLPAVLERRLSCVVFLNVSAAIFHSDVPIISLSKPGERGSYG